MNLNRKGRLLSSEALLDFNFLVALDLTGEELSG